MAKQKKLVVVNKHGVRSTVVDVVSVPSAEGDVWCVRLRDDADGCIDAIPMDGFIANFTKVES
jgi:hypothetical protein